MPGAKQPAAAPPQPQPNAQPTPKPTPPMNQQWKCELHGMTASEIPEKLTVGAPILANCEGETSAILRSGLKIELNDQQTYELHLLEVRELTGTKATLVVTPWRAGELKMTNPALTDGKTRVGMGDLELTVASVINPKDNPEGKPFPPLHPLDLPWPIWLWVVVGAIATGALYILSLLVRRSLKRKKLRTLLEKNATALSPVNHLNKEMRKLQRKIPLQGQAWPTDEARAFFAELESQFRWFLARELVIPAISDSPRAILREMKRTDLDVYKHSGRDVRVALLEMRKGQSSEDAVQLMDLARKTADKIAKERNA